MMKSIYRFVVFFTFVIATKANAQGFYEHEFGMSTGIYQLRSDYGERFDRETNSANQGLTFALTYYLNRASRRTANYFMEHTKYRIDLIYSSVDLKHQGQWSDDPRLEAMTGTFSNMALSTGLEYYPFGVKIQSYSRTQSFFQSFSPYAGIGVGLNFVSPDAKSSLEGGLSNPSNVFPTFQSTDDDNGIILDNRLVASLNLRTGIKFDIGLRDGLIIESSWMLFGSDLVDGLKPIGPQNKYTDWSWGINIGYSRLFF